MREARGEVLAIQSSDDLYLPGAVSASVEALRESPGVGFVYGDAEYIDAGGRVTGRTHLLPWSLESYLGRETYVNQAATFFRSEAARETGYWDEDVAYAADSDYWLRMGIRFGGAKVERLLARYRYHEAQRDRAGTRPAEDWERAVRKRIVEFRLPPELRRRARSGIHLTWHHYTPESKWKTRTTSLYKALAADPRGIWRRGFPRRELLPGREPLWKLLSRVKRLAGSLALDEPRLAWPLLVPGGAKRRWCTFRNRGDTIVANPEGEGFALADEWTSDLTLAATFRWAAKRLLRAALVNWPIDLADSRASEPGGDPEVSFVVGHRGAERLPLLLATLASLRNQRGCSVEVIVVEQAAAPVLHGRLPEGVRLVHQAPPDPGMEYSRSWAFNRGAREARGGVVVFHDNDILAPAGYAAELKRLALEGAQVMRLMRFLFYLDETSTRRLVNAEGTGADLLGAATPEVIRQNCQGGTLAVEREAYFGIGGHDERFLGWGGEDNEFYDRCRLLRLHEWGYLPFVHLWHGSQASRARQEAVRAFFDAAVSRTREERARRLTGLPLGADEGPTLRGRA